MVREPIRVRLESKAFGVARAKVHKFSGVEEISRLPLHEVEVTFDADANIDIGALPGASISIILERTDQEELRRSHGIITSVEVPCEASPAAAPIYRFVIGPRAHRLSLIQTQEVFIDRSVPEIIKEKLARVGIGDRDVVLRLLDKYPKRELVIQYKETDLAFVSRLAEHLGISFFFEHADGRDKMIFTDHISGFAPIAGNASVPFQPPSGPPSVERLTSRYDVVPASYVVSDYNYRTPHVDLTAIHESAAGSAGGVVEYGTHHRNPAEGAQLARIRAEEREAQARFHTGEGSVPDFGAGQTFTLKGHPSIENEAPLLIVKVGHELTTMADNSHNYRNTFRLTDARSCFRPARITPQPRIHGVITAVIEPRVDGSTGNVASIDRQGRYTIKFNFDTSPVGERAHSSHWVRMIHAHVGPNYGAHMPLKAGIEVLVTFIDGDPDRPLIVGAVHNPLTPSPVDGRDPQMHRTKTASGIEIMMRDEF